MALPSAYYPTAIIPAPGEINTSKDSGLTYDTVAASDYVIPGGYLNQIAVDLRAVQSELGTDVSGSLSTLRQRLAVSLSDAGTINNDTVTYAMMTNVSATDKILGRKTAGAGDIEEIDCNLTGRQSAMGLTNESAYNDDATLTSASSGKVLTNYGASKDIVFTLPAAAAGLQYTFRVVASFKITVNPAGANLITDSDASTNTTMYCSQPIQSACLAAVQNGASAWTWCVDHIYGANWTIE